MFEFLMLTAFFTIGLSQLLPKDRKSAPIKGKQNQPEKVPRNARSKKNPPPGSRRSRNLFVKLHHEASA